MSAPSWATAVAHPNIALVKYWGKRDENLILPFTDSLSLTLDVYPTTTTVRLRPPGEQDVVLIDGRPAGGDTLRRVTAFLDLLRRLSRRREAAVVDTHNTVPIGAGLASSAAGFAALALAGATAYEADLDPTALSRLARRGSGSAARSVFGGFVVWYAGPPDAPDPDQASYAEPLSDARLDAALIAVLVQTGRKAVPSREAMHRTAATSPLFHDWVETSRADLRAMRTALAKGDLATVGALAERNALGMHATMEQAHPPVTYRTPASHQVLAHVRRMRERGEQTWSTMDAGPNVKVLCPAADAQRLAGELADVFGCPTLVARPGPGARVQAGTSS